MFLEFRKFIFNGWVAAARLPVRLPGGRIALSGGMAKTAYSPGDRSQNIGGVRRLYRAAQAFRRQFLASGPGG
jgi:hypothetical protein